MCSGDGRLYRSQDDPRIRARGPRGGEVTEPDTDELEPGALVAGELGRLAHQPRQEAHRLHDVADAGESGSAPFIEIGAIGRLLRYSAGSGCTSESPPPSIAA